MDVKEWDNILFGINKGLGMVQVLLQSEGEQMSKTEFQERVAELQSAAHAFSYSGVKDGN